MAEIVPSKPMSVKSSSEQHSAAIVVLIDDVFFMCLFPFSWQNKETGAGLLHEGFQQGIA